MISGDRSRKVMWRCARRCWERRNLTRRSGLVSEKCYECGQDMKSGESCECKIPRVEQGGEEKL